MSEGDSWLLKSVYDMSLLLRDTSGANRPVEKAEEMVRRFCTKELRGVPGGVGDVEEYIANAALDLVIMGVWSLVAGQVDEEALPVSITLKKHSVSTRVTFIRCSETHVSSWHQPSCILLGRRPDGHAANHQTHTFARDLRTYTSMLEAVEECKKAGKWGKVSTRLKGMIGTLTDIAGDTRKSVRSRLKDIQEVFDR